MPCPGPNGWEADEPGLNPSESGLRRWGEKCAALSSQALDWLKWGLHLSSHSCTPQKLRWGMGSDA